MWLIVWGETFGAKETAILFFCGGTFGYLALKLAVRSGGGSAVRRVYCRILKWANAPPEWRVEDSYVSTESSSGRKML